VFKDHSLYGFCILRLEWAAANVAVCHFGFYQVKPSLCCNFIAHVKKALGENLFKVYEKQVASLMDCKPSKPSQDKTFNLPEGLGTVLFDPTKKAKRFRNFFETKTDVCHQRDWSWKSDNAATVSDYLNALIKQRLKEGFLYVSPQPKDNEESTASSSSINILE